MLTIGILFHLFLNASVSLRLFFIMRHASLRRYEPSLFCIKFFLSNSNFFPLVMHPFLRHFFTNA